MSSVNLLAREVSAKIVFYGPGLSGKTTSLKKIFESVKPAHRGEMMSLATEGDRTLFFDFLPVKVERVGDCAVRLALYTVPGQVFYNATRKLVLQGADGVVFVADSQADALERNTESLKNLEENLFEQGIRLERFPLVIQWNKRDVPNVMTVDDLRRHLNPRGVPEFETCAMSGRGILDTLKAVTRLVIKDLRNKRIVPGPSMAPAPIAFGAPGGGAIPNLEGQLQQHLTGRKAAVAAAPPPPSVAPLKIAPAPAIASVAQAIPPSAQLAPRPSVIASSGAVGPCSALATDAVLDYAKTAERAFSGGDHLGCVKAAFEGVRKVLGITGEETLGQQAFLLGMHGPDVFKLQSLQKVDLVRVDDAAFALYVLMQALVRASNAGLGETA